MENPHITIGIIMCDFHTIFAKVGMANIDQINKCIRETLDRFGRKIPDLNKQFRVHLRTDDSGLTLGKAYIYFKDSRAFKMLFDIPLRLSTPKCVHSQNFSRFQIKNLHGESISGFRYNEEQKRYLTSKGFDNHELGYFEIQPCESKVCGSISDHNVLTTSVVNDDISGGLQEIFGIFSSSPQYPQIKYMRDKYQIIFDPESVDSHFAYFFTKKIYIRGKEIRVYKST